MINIQSEKLIELLNQIKILNKGIIVYLKKEENENRGKITEIANWDREFYEEEEENENKKVKAIKVEIVNSSIEKYKENEKLLISLYGGITLIYDNDTLEELILIEEKDIIAILN